MNKAQIQALLAALDEGTIVGLNREQATAALTTLIAKIEDNERLTEALRHLRHIAGHEVLEEIIDAALNNQKGEG